MLMHDELEYLWQIFRLHFVLKDEPGVKKAVTALYEKPRELPEMVDSLLLEYWNGWDDALLFRLARTSVERFFFDLERHVALVALLVCGGKVTQKEAVTLIGGAGSQGLKVHPTIQRVLDIVWLIRQDSALGLEGVGDDGELKEALTEVIRGYLK